MQNMLLSVIIHYEFYELFYSFIICGFSNLDVLKKYDLNLLNYEVPIITRICFFKLEFIFTG